MKAFLTLQHGNSLLGTLHLELYDDVPRTVHNFTQQCQRPQNGYRGSVLHRIVPGFLAQGGDYKHGENTSGISVDGPTFRDENFSHQHIVSGTLSMANSGGPDTNGSQFYITFRPAPQLDNKHVVFGHVDLRQSADVLEALEAVATNDQEVPLLPVTIIDCGVVDASVPLELTVTDNDEIDIEEDDTGNESCVDKVGLEQENNDTQQAVDSNEELDKPRTKAEELKMRLRVLKQKVNQARQLNQKAVQEEGERLSYQGKIKEQSRQRALHKKAQDEAWQQRHAKALELAQPANIDPKSVTQQAAESLQKAQIRAEKAEANMYSMTDYHNPEGQHRNYQRNIKSLPRNTTMTDTTTATYNPLQNDVDPMKQLEGARRLAAEMKRRIEKKKQKDLKRRIEKGEDEDVSHINKRNRHFNEKISRNYDQHTAQIRQNLERGTAL